MNKKIKIFSCTIVMCVLMLVPCNSATAIVIGPNETVHGCDTINQCLTGQWLQQGHTSWCLAACMNIVYQDCLVHNAHAINPGFNQIFAQNPTPAFFAELAFILAPGVIDSNLNFDALSLNAQNYLTSFFNSMRFPNFLQQIFNISEHFKTLSIEKRNNIWNGGIQQPTFAQQLELLGGNPQEGLTAMPEEIKNAINISGISVNLIFNNILAQDSTDYVKVVDIPVGQNPWRIIFDDILNNNRIVIINMIYTNGAHHSLVVYGVYQETADDGNVVNDRKIMLYDPSNGRNDILVDVDSRDTVSLVGINARIDSFIGFNY
ncbi:MAG: hypothetical protein LBS28_03505 [Streptococcaceae bacterium]|nr:hypothetical protein [Streptococcaceae bacterium]